MLGNPRSPRARAVAKLAQRSQRADTGLFLLEGPQALREALEYRPEALADLFVTPTALQRHPELAAALTAAGLEPEFATEEVLGAMADTVTPQGFVAVCAQFPVGLTDIFNGSPRLVAVLEEVRDPGNAGTIVRAADSAGADAVIFTGRSVDLYNPKVVRSTTGSLFHLPIAVSQSFDEVVGLARSAGLSVLAADVSGEELPTLRLDGRLRRETAWVFGNEARGLTDDQLRQVDQVVAVPVYGRAESLNLATAASVCLYESAFAQRSASG